MDARETAFINSLGGSSSSDKSPPTSSGSGTRMSDQEFLSSLETVEPSTARAVKADTATTAFGKSAAMAAPAGFVGGLTGLAGAGAVLAIPAVAAATPLIATGAAVTGALVLGFGGSALAQSLIDDLTKKPGIQDLMKQFGFGNEQLAKNRAEYPTTTMAGAITGSTLAGGMRPGWMGLGPAALGAGLNTAVTGGQQVAHGEFDPKELAMSAVAGLVSKPTKLANMIQAGTTRRLTPAASTEAPPAKEPIKQTTKTSTVLPKEEADFIAELYASAARDKATQEAATKPPVVEETKATTEEVVPAASKDVSSNTPLLPANRFATRQAQEDRISDLQEVVKGGLEPDHPAPIKGMNDVKAELAALETSRLPPETREHYKTDIEGLETQASDILFKADAATNRGDNVAAKQFEAESNGIQARADELRAKMPEANIKNKVAPTPKELDDFLWGTTTVTQALDKIHAANIGGKASLVLNRLIRNHQSIADTLFKSQKEPLIYDGEAIGGYWEHKANRVTLGPNAENGMATFYHETLHPIIQNVLKDNTSRAAIRLEQLWKEVKDAKTGVIDPFTGKPHYGFTDKFEFLAEAYTNASFQRLLQGITYPTTTPGKFTTAWNALKEIIKDAIGAKDAATRSALDEVLEVGSRVIEQNRKVKYEYRPDNNEVVSKSAPVDDPAPVPKPVKVQDIGSLKELEDAAKIILKTEGEAAARQFYRDWRTYRETWTHPVNEADKAIQTNVNNKTANDRIIAINKATMLKLEPDVVARETIAKAIDAGKTDTLVGKDKEVANLFTDRMADIGKRAKESETVTGLLENYVSHIVEWKGIPETIKEQFFSTVLGGGGAGKGMSPETRFGKRRTFETFEDLQAHLDDFNAGLRRSGSEFQLNIKTKDIAEIYSVYAQSMERAIENKKLIETLKTIRNIDGTLQLQQYTNSKDIPRGWEPIPSKQFPGYFADPSLIPSLKFAFDAGPGELMNALGNVSQVVKRLNVIGSLFHAKTLMEVMSNTDIPIWTPIKEVGLGGVDKLLGTKYSGLTKALEQFRKGGLGDSVDSWIKHNLMLQTPEDVQIGLIPKLGQLADDLIVKHGPNVRVLEKSLSTVEKYTLRYLDHFTWDYLHTGGKLMVADTMLTNARLAHAKQERLRLGDKDSEKIPFDEDAARTNISSYLNKAFGGLNWFAEATAAKTEMGKRMAMASYSPAGRRGLQVVLFAPDWTISTIKAFTAALPNTLNPKDWHPIRGIKGMATPTTTADYARLYQMKTVLTYLIVVNGLNMVTAGRPIWDNKDPTRLEFEDGTSIQVMKHAAEPYHWITDPLKTLSNKLGFVPKAAGVALTGNEYLGPTAQKLTDPSVLGRAKAIAGSALPFQIQAANTAPEGEGVRRAVMGTLGFPELGATKAQLRVKRAEREKLLKEAAGEYRKNAREKGW